VSIGCDEKARTEEGRKARVRSRKLHCWMGGSAPVERVIMTRSNRFLAVVFACLAIPSLALAALKDVGPVTATGFPAWYRDTSANALALCTEQRPSPNASAGGAPLCFPIVPDPAGYAGNLGGEVFYYNASTTLTGANGFNILWEGAIEATYATGVPIRGDEITFARIRIRMDTGVPGTYRVFHPYGTEVFPDVGVGTKAVNVTVDIGVAPGVFTGALAGSVGPFLEWDQNVANPTSPFGIDPASGTAYSLALSNADGSQVLFVGDPNFEHTVSGSPFLQNFLRIEGPPGSNLDGAGNDFIQTNTFAVLGQRFTAPIAQALAISRANISVDRGGWADVDVWAKSVPGAQLIATAGGVPTVALSVDTLGDAFGHAEFQLAGPVDSILTVTNVSDNPASAASAPLSDFVSTSLAFMDPITRGISIIAETSVQVGSPTITVVELPGALKTVDPLTPWIQRFDATIPPGVNPPISLTAQSTMGGSHLEPVQMGATPGAATPVGPLALPLLVTTSEGTPVVVSDASWAAGTVMLLNPPASGTAVAGAGQITYTPKNLFFGTDSFTYLLFVTDATGTVYSNKGVVTVDVTAVNNPPTAVADALNTTPGIPVTGNLAANDTDVDGTVVAASVVIVTAPAHGAVLNNLNGTVTYIPAAGFTGTDTFTYTIADNGGAVSAPATVTVIVTAPETLTIIRADWTVNKQRYRIDGTSSVFGAGLANTVEVRAGSLPTGALIGTATISAAGAWTMDVISPVQLDNTNRATARSTGGGVVSFTMRRR
jgi:Bacterial Ig domain